MTGDTAVAVQQLGKCFARYEAARPAAVKHLVKWWLTRGKVEHFWALREVELEVERGQMLGIVGRNGSGKSTLLRIIGGVMRPTQGRVRVAGRIGGLLQLGVGFHSDLSGRDNVFINGIIAGLTREEVKRRFDAIVAFAELEDFIDNPLRTYSTGMRMRLGFATAVHSDPDVLLIDEVLTVGDLGFQRKCLRRIEEYKAAGCAIMLVSHSLEDVEQHCERALWLHRGRVAAYGDPAQVVEPYRTAMLDETRRRAPEGPHTRTTSRGYQLVLHQNRSGSLEMEIDDVRLLDTSGRETEEIERGEALTVEIHYHAPEPIHSPIFNVSIANERDFHCCDVNTQAAGLVLPDLHGRGRLVLHLGRLDLAAGEYFVNVGAYEAEWSHVYDSHWRAYPLRVRSQQVDAGVLSPPRRWELHQDLERLKTA
jgi:lipopolysaccharide transport system ATP-binding protein